MKKKKEIQQELESLSPFLAKMKAKQGEMQAPENYFQSLPDQVLEQLRMETKATPATVAKPHTTWLEELTNSIAWLIQPRYAMALGAVLVLVVSGFLVWRNVNQQRPTAELADITSEEALYYVRQNLEDFESHLLVEKELPENSDDFFNATELNDELIDEYLQDKLEDIDDQTLEQLLN
jgi:hypothetical protein